MSFQQVQLHPATSTMVISERICTSNVTQVNYPLFGGSFDTLFIPPFLSGYLVCSFFNFLRIQVQLQLVIQLEISLKIPGYEVTDSIVKICTWWSGLVLVLAEGVPFLSLFRCQRYSATIHSKSSFYLLHYQLHFFLKKTFSVYCSFKLSEIYLFSSQSCFSLHHV